MTESACVLMFSGGRDSTLAAIRLAPKHPRLTLVTVTSDHLVGVEAVRRRLLELKRHLPPDTDWLLVRQPEGILDHEASFAPTCLPCHHAYVAVGARVAAILQITNLAFGYTGYQSSWPEQTTYAVEKLSAVLSTARINLVLPVYDVDRKEDAITELSLRGLSPVALEQKCLRQLTNVSLHDAHLHREVDRWGDALRSILQKRDQLHLDIREQHSLESFRSIG